MDIKVTYTNALMTPIESIDCESIKWYNLRASKDVKIREGEFTQVPLGVILDIPDGYEGQIILKKNTFKKYGVILVSGLEIVSAQDSKELEITLYATRDIKINFNDRICQLKIVKCQDEINFIKN